MTHPRSINSAFAGHHNVNDTILKIHYHTREQAEQARAMREGPRRAGWYWQGVSPDTTPYGPFSSSARAYRDAVTRL